MSNPADETSARAQGEEFFGDSFGLIEQYVDILTSRGVEWGLLGPREPERIWSRHIMNCAALSELIAQGSSVLDVGSGAGLPGLVLAIARDDLRITLLEPLLRRFNFLVQAVDELGLGETVTVERGRVEDLKPAQMGVGFDVVTCRAVAKLPKLLGWSHRAIAPGGQLLALKGASAEAEVAESAGSLKRMRLQAVTLQVRPLPQAEPAHVVRVTAS